MTMTFPLMLLLIKPDSCLRCECAKKGRLWLFRFSRRFIRLVLFIADLFHPVDGFAVEPFHNRDVRHGRSWRGAVPMLLTRRAPDHVARPNLLDRPSPAL